MSKFDALAIAAVLRSGRITALAGHVGMVLFALLRRPEWAVAIGFLAWLASIYLSIRVELDARFFVLLAEHDATELDRFLDASGFRKNAGPRSLDSRRAGAIRLWRALIAAVVVELAAVAVCWWRS
jgi:hypothetical protein